MLFLSVRKFYNLFFVGSAVLSILSCGTVEKSYLSLNNHDYYSAFNGFNDGLKRDSSACAYGLSLYYDSPVTGDIDSSLKYILIAEKHWSNVTQKSRLSLAAYDFDSIAIEHHKQKLGDELFMNCKSKNSYTCLDLFIEQHYWSRKLEEAFKLRDSLVLAQVLLNESVWFAMDMAQKYPNSIYMSELKNAIDLYEYQNYVKSFNEADLARFIETYPDNSHVGIVEDSIYAIYERNSGYKIFEKFIEVHSSNRNIEKAWKELYRRYTENFKPELILEFEQAYPDYPFKEEINLDSELLEIEFFPFTDSLGMMGYTDSTGSWLIEPEYDDAGFFYNGIAGVERNEKMGLINKKNELIVDFIFDDVETDSELYVVSSNDFFGIINRNGDFIFDTLYQDISLLNDGFVCAQKDSLYAFYDRSGVKLTEEVYDFVLNFNSGVCPVSINGKRGLLDLDLQLVIPCIHEAIYPFSDSLFIIVNNDNFRQLCNRDGRVINDSLFQEIHRTENGIALCVKDDKIGYLDKNGKQIIENRFEPYVDYDLLGNFIDGRAIVYNDKFGIIDSTGEFLLKPKYKFIKNLIDYFGVQKDEGWAIMNGAYRLITKYEYESLDLLNNRFILFKKNGKFGLMDRKLNVILEAMYTSISEMGNYLIISNGQGNALYDSNGDQFLPFDQWSFYNADPNHLVVVNMQTGIIQKYIVKETRRIVSQP